MGMSFECEVDRFLFHALSRVRELPVDVSSWIIVNPNKEQLRETRSLILSALPCAIVHARPSGFREWIADGLPELKIRGTLAN
jgi:hypothetical protein